MDECVKCGRTAEFVELVRDLHDDDRGDIAMCVECMEPDKSWCVTCRRVYNQRDLNPVTEQCHDCDPSDWKKEYEEG